jgi:hypothetical protein
LQEAFGLLGVSRSRFYQWQTVGLISPNWHNGNRPMYLRVEVLALPGRLSKSTGPLLPPEDQALAKERAEPDFNGVFTERFERLVPSLGEDEARVRAIAHVTRLYRRHHHCAYKAAKVAVLALITPKPAPAEPASEPEIDSTFPLLPQEDQKLAVEREREPEPWVHE